MASVKFLKGLASAYAGLTNKNADTFYYTTDDNQLYLGTIRLSNTNEVVAAVERIAKNEADIVTINAALTKIQGDASVEGSIKKAVADAKAELEGKMGSLESLNTKNKATLVEAINEVLTAVGAGGTAAAVTMVTNDTTDYAASYTLKQGDNTIGTINVPKDMVVKSGAVEVNPEGKDEGTYIVLTLANATEDKIYVNVGTLVDIYKAQETAAQVQIAIDADTREISATIVAGSIGANELAQDAVTTAKIADGNVTKAKLSTEVQASLNKADAAVQVIAAGSANGAISVDGVDVAVTGLKSAAYAETTAFDAAGSAAAVESAANTKITNVETTLGARITTLENAVGGSGSIATQIEDAKEAAITTANKYTDDKIATLDADVKSATVEAGKGIQVQVIEVDGKVDQVVVSGDYSNAYDAKGAAATAEANAKAYADEAMTWGTM